MYPSAKDNFLQRILPNPVQVGSYWFFINSVGYQPNQSILLYSKAYLFYIYMHEYKIVRIRKILQFSKIHTTSNLTSV